MTGLTALSETERDRQRNIVLDRRCDDVLGSDDVRLNGLERVVLTCRHLLQSCGVNNDIDSAHRPGEARKVANVSDQVAEPIVVGSHAPAELGLL